MTTTDTITWMDPAKQEPPLRTSLAVVLDGQKVFNGMYVVGPASKRYYNLNGTRINPERITAWIVLPAVPEWAKFKPTVVKERLTQDDYRKRNIAWDNGVEIYKLTNRTA